MNAPHFNVGNLPLQAGTTDYMKAVVAEQKRCCNKIDTRIVEVENEYFSMNKELKVLGNKIEGLGFFARWSVSQKMKSISRRMSILQAALVKLYDARWRRTYG
jgi:hypothetical protein